jgi:preprotein translocase subunit SecD
MRRPISKILLVLFCLLVSSIHAQTNALHFILAPQYSAANDKVVLLKQTMDVLQSRLNKFDTENKAFVRDTLGDKIAVSLRTNKADGIKAVLTTPGQLSIFETFDNALFYKTYVGPIIKATPSFGKLLTPNIVMMPDSHLAPGACIGFAQAADTAAVNLVLNDKKLFSKNIVFGWSYKPTKEGKFELFALRGRPVLSGKFITNAQAGTNDKLNYIYIAFDITDKNKWATITSDNIGKALAICVDGKVYSAPTVNGMIANGRCQITGAFTIDEAKALADILNLDPLPAALLITSQY